MSRQALSHLEHFGYLVCAMRVSQHTGVKDTIMWKECVVKKSEVPGLEQASLIRYALLACARSVIQNNKQVFISVIIRCQILKIIVC